ncbi:alpha,alpha-trehalose-phosphate synthase (UDP-forming) [Phyllobacterium salinisoli]|uniref:Trehalose-6-phosphate synthase n=1 Tax=Phyllobacterium salinisoli TaxID=1899321 RepID=A0A368K993_9HYPH|nr:alpha,alpha-trehalose-phosphate synthase (UDP-forming) [Phyllobacterium salinisoli]RCS25053.1 alpha,alpha-trehalose-phosphate synthase (UDP-forming) [Phyllobacterium salinisoli]
MSRLVVISNRVPLPDKSGTAPAGGLAVALQSALEERGGVWMGWSGKSIPSREKPGLNIQEHGKITYALVDLSRKDVDEYYAGFANRVLWPLCHYRLDLTEYARKDMAGYFRVNRLFAHHLAPLIKPDDVIWVHDYHLIPLASELRQMGLKNRIGFFLHIPWPPADVLFTLPVHETIMRGLASYDVIGFQTAHDVENFAGCLKREGIGRELGDGLFEAYGHVFRADVFPISIDTGAFAQAAQNSQRNAMVQRMHKSLGDRDLIIGVDRLDYSKGITNRIEAFEHFITNNPASQGKVTFLQITPKSRSEVPEYEDMQRTVAELAGRVNGAISAVDWVPIRYVNRSIGRNVLAGLYRMARVGLVTPLRDGMNLVAKEYVAAQRSEDPGVLILSRFAGAARELDGALLVNPYDIEAVSNAIARALSMPLEARRERWNQMMPHLLEHDVSRWCTSFLDALAEHGETGKPRQPAGSDQAA